MDWEGQDDLQQGIPDDPREDVNYPPLSISPAINREEIIRVLLENCGNTVHPFDKWTQLFMAVLSGETEIVELLLEMNPGEFDTPCETANLIFEVCIHDRYEHIVRCLLKKGVKITLEPDANMLRRPCDPLSLALHRNDYEMVKPFHEYPMNVVVPGGMLPLHFAAANASEPLIQFFLAHHSSIDIGGDQTALEVARKRWVANESGLMRELEANRVALLACVRSLAALERK